MNKSFSIREALSYGWNTFKKNWKFLVMLFIGLTILRVVLGYLGNPQTSPLREASSIVYIINTVLGVFISAGLVQTILKIYNGQKPMFRDVISSRKSAWKYFLGSLLLMLVILVCMIPIFVSAGSFILSGFLATDTMPLGTSFLIFALIGIVLVVYFSIMFSFWAVSLFDKNLKVVESLKYSARITKGHRGKLFIFAIVLGFLNILGLLCLVAGLLVTISITLLSQVWVYKKLDMLYIAKQGNPVPTPIPVKQSTEVIEQPKEIPSHLEENK